MRRVFITGMGCVTPIGNTVQQFRESLFAGRNGLREVTGIRPGDLGFTRVGRIENFSPEAVLSPAQIQISERCSQLGLVAAREALLDSGVLANMDRAEMAIVLGCSTAGRSVEEAETAKLYTRGARVHPLTVPRVMASSGTSLISMEHGITGPAYTVSTACASATHAIGQAFHLVRSGAVGAALCGGHEAPLTYGFLKAWDSLRVVSPTQCRPFGADRDGMTLAEGAGMLVIESEESARARNATIYGEIAGFGMSSDAHHITQARPEGPAAAIRMAQRDAQASVKDVGYINAHGTGTQVNDRVEALAIHQVFSDCAPDIPVSSTKALHGHAMGASGAMEAIAVALALRESVVPGNVVDGEVDPALHLRVLGRQNLQEPVQLALSHSFAFGGLNAVLAVRRVEEGVL